MSWNINGWHERTYIVREQIIKSLKQDIIIIKETQLEGYNAIYIDGYEPLMHIRRDRHRLAPRQFGGVAIQISKHLLNVYNITKVDKQIDGIYTVNAAKNSFWRYFNLFISDYGHIYSFKKKELFRQYCCSYHGSPLWPLQSHGVESLCVAWRKALRIIWKVHPQTHCGVIAALSGQKPLILSLRARFVNYFSKCLKNYNNVVKSVACICKSNPMSCAGNNYRMLLNAKMS